MKVIGGYFELELAKGEEYHKDAIRLNTGRNAFEYILKAKGYKKVYLPFYTCDVMLEPIIKLNITCEFYSIRNNFEPIFDFHKVMMDEVFVYTNYFGVCDRIVKKLSEQCKNLIIDNSQAFYSTPLPDIDTFYSVRKFFGVPDGAYLYTDTLFLDNLETDISYQRFEHLLGRADIGAEKFYTAFKNNDESLNNQPIKQMSKISQKMLSGVDYQSISDKRIENFNSLHCQLKNINQLNITIESNITPMIYPLLIENGEKLKKKLIHNKVFIATYWPNVKEWVDMDSLEMYLSDNLVCIPIDQRNNEKDMERMKNLILNYA